MTFREIVAYDWVESRGGRMLHHLAVADWDDAERNWGANHGTASCGLQSMFWIPGIFSRMGAPRCKRCCRATGLPQGKGSPKNDPECRKLLGLAPDPSYF